MAVYYVLANEPNWNALKAYHKIVIDLHHETGNLREKAMAANEYIRSGGQVSMYLNSALQKGKPGYDQACNLGFKGKSMSHWRGENYLKSGCYSSPQLQGALLKQLDDWEHAGLDKKGVRVFVDNCDYKGTSAKDMAGFFLGILRKGYAVEGQNMPVAVAKAIADTPEGRAAISQGRVFHSPENVVLRDMSDTIKRTMAMYNMGIRVGSFTEYLRLDVTGGGKNFTWKEATDQLNKFYTGLKDAGMPAHEISRINALHFIAPDQRVGIMPDKYQQAQALPKKMQDAALDRGGHVANPGIQAPYDDRQPVAQSSAKWHINTPRTEIAYATSQSDWTVKLPANTDAKPRAS